MARAAVAPGPAPPGAAATPHERRERLRARLPEVDAEALLVTSLANIRYLSGFTGSAAALLVRAQGPDVFFTDLRYRTQIEGEIDPGLEAVVAAEKPGTSARRYVAEGSGRLAFERAHLSFAEWESWREAGRELVGVEGWIESQRSRKSPGELDAIRRAAAIADVVFEPVLRLLRPGVTEREVAAELDHRLVAAGSEGVAFPSIVAFGEHAALPHARPTARPLARGDIVLFDYGAVAGGYHSDLSRTVAFGPPAAELVEAYGVVRDAQAAAIAGLTAGMTGREADALARTPIAEAGYGERFEHSLGHGIGLEVHEAPRLARTSEDRLEPQAVVTIEPGVYIESTGGIRVEDDVLVGPQGVEVLTAAPKETLLIL